MTESQAAAPANMNLFRMPNDPGVLRVEATGLDSEGRLHTVGLFFPAAVFVRQLTHALGPELAEHWLQPKLEWVLSRAIDGSREPATVGDLLVMEDMGFRGGVGEQLGSWEKFIRWRLEAGVQMLEMVGTACGLNDARPAPPAQAESQTLPAQAESEPPAPAQAESERPSPPQEPISIASSLLAAEEMRTELRGGGAPHRSPTLSPVLQVVR